MRREKSPWIQDRLQVTAERKRVSFKRWVILLLALASVGYILYSDVSESAELGDNGFLTKGTHMCDADRIIPETVDDLEQWRALIERLNAVDDDVTKLSKDDNRLGGVLSKWCGTLSEGYPVVLFNVDGDYALATWDKSLGFTLRSFIIRLSDFQSGGLRL